MKKNKFTLAVDTTSLNSSCALTYQGKTVDIITSCGFMPVAWKEHLDFLPLFHRDHLANNIIDLLKKNNVTWPQIENIAVSAQSGVSNCLLVGTTIAKTLAVLYGKPVLEVDHILAHIYSAWIDRPVGELKFPILVFSASGSHNELALIKNKKACDIIYDKLPPIWKGEDGKGDIALGIGNVFSRFKNKLGMLDRKSGSRRTMDELMEMMDKGDNKRFNFKKYYHGKIMDLDFSGYLKKVFDFINKNRDSLDNYGSDFTKDLAASFQESLTEIISQKIMAAAKLNNAKEIHITGGVSCNNYLEKKLADKIKKLNNKLILRFPVKKEYRLDNAGMIGVLAYYQKLYKIKFNNFKVNIT